jgi:hypothetical protein
MCARIHLCPHRQGISTQQGVPVLAVNSLEFEFIRMQEGACEAHHMEADQLGRHGCPLPAASHQLRVSTRTLGCAEALQEAAAGKGGGRVCSTPGQAGG